MSNIDVLGLKRDSVTGALLVKGVADLTHADLIVPLHGIYFPLAAQAVVANRLYWNRGVSPANGYLRYISWAITAQSGNCIVSAYDCGAAAASVYTKLGDSGSVAVVAANAWQIWDPGATAIPVTQGQQIMMGILFDNAVATVGRGGAISSANFAQLPNSSFLASPTLPKITAIRDTGSFSVPANVAEVNALTSGLSLVSFAHVTEA